MLFRLTKWIMLLGVLCCWACHDPIKEQQELEEVVKVSCDESFNPLLQTSVQLYEYFYPNAHMQVKFTSETEAIRDLLHDSCEIVISCRELNQQEQAFFKQRKFNPQTVKIARDAVVLLMNKNNPDSAFTFEALANALATGRLSWKALFPHASDAEIKIAIDHKNSSVSRYLRDSVLQGKAFQENCFALQNAEEVIRYVENNHDAIGFIPSNWISNDRDPKCKDILRRIKVAAISSKKDPARFYKPVYQNFIYDLYPLLRNVYMIHSEHTNGLGTGFVNFMAGKKGQLLIKKEGLLPNFGHLTSRDIEIER
jgi:phosphate transport system substrate-binding protein